MKKTLLIAIPVLLLLLSSSMALKSEDVEDIGDEWNREYEGMGISHFFDIKPSSDGGYILAGTTWEPYEGQQDTGNGWLVKLDETGDVIWKRHYGGVYEDGLWRVVETDGGYVAGGYTYSYGRGDEDFWLIKVDREGNELWNKTYGGGDTEELGKIIKAKEGGYLIVGVGGSFGTNGSILLIKTDDDGDIEWYKVFGGNGFEGAEGIIELEDGYLISGTTGSYATHGEWDTWLIKVDEEGNEIWNKTYGWPGYAWNAFITELEDGYAIYGWTVIEPSEVTNGYLIKIDKEGNEQWKKRYGGNEWDYLTALGVLEDGYILCGFTESYSAGNFDGWLLKVDKQGNEIWNKSFGRKWEEKFQGIVVLNDGYLLCGKTEHEWGHSRAWLVKCNDEAPPTIKIVKPRENYLYLFDREIMPYDKTLIIGGVTVTVEADRPEKIDSVEFYFDRYNHATDKPQKIDYSLPYEWKCRKLGSGMLPNHVTAVAPYGNSGAVAVDKTDVYIFNIIP